MPIRVGGKWDKISIEGLLKDEAGLQFGASAVKGALVFQLNMTRWIAVRKAGHVASPNSPAHMVHVVWSRSQEAAVLWPASAVLWTVHLLETCISQVGTGHSDVCVWDCYCWIGKVWRVCMHVHINNGLCMVQRWVGMTGIRLFFMVCTYHGTKAQSLLGDLLSFAFCRRNECYFKDQLSVVRYKTGYVNVVESQYLFNATYST